MNERLEYKEASPHYKLAGKALIGLGSINVCVALYLLMQSATLGFIDTQTMVAFGTLFVVTGFWFISTSQQFNDESHTHSNAS